MKAQELGQTLVNLIKAEDYGTIYGKHYSPEILSVEASGEEYKGMDAIQAKNAWWEENFELHSSSVEGPFPHGDNSFGLIFDMDVTEKANNQRFSMRELAIYDVEDGRIVRERFFYQS